MSFEENFVMGLSGTHGTGKSTILNGLADKGYFVNRSQLSRTAQKNLGWDNLSKAQESREDMWALQDAILAALIQRDIEVNQSEELTVVERTPADLWAYTELWYSRLGLDIRDDSRAAEYNAACQTAMQKYRVNFLVHPDPAIPFVAEPNRADEQSRDFIDTRLSVFLKSTTTRSYTIFETEKSARIKEVSSQIIFTKYFEFPTI